MSFPGLLNLQAHFDYLFIVTNQQGVAKGLMTVEDVEQIHETMKNKLAGQGIKIHHIYVAYESKNRFQIPENPTPHWASSQKRLPRPKLETISYGRRYGVRYAIRPQSKNEVRLDSISAPLQRARAPAFVRLERRESIGVEPGHPTAFPEKKK